MDRPGGVSAAPRRLELHLSYACPQRCAFCSESGRMARWRRWPVRGEEVARVLVERRRRGFDHLTLTGGEPTAHPALPAALEAAKRLGFRTYVTTNGGRFAEEDYARRVLPLVDELCLSVHGPDAETHDAAAGTPGSFERALRARDRVAAHGRDTLLRTNTVVTRANWERLPETVRLLLGRLGARHCLLSNVAPEGRAARAYAALAVPLSAWRARVEDLARPFAEAGAALTVFGLPLCALAGRDELSNDLRFSPRVTVERRASGGRPGLAGIASADASRGRRKPAACAACSDRSSCAGVFARYLALRGDGELVPRRRP